MTRHWIVYVVQCKRTTKHGGLGGIKPRIRFARLCGEDDLQEGCDQALAFTRAHEIMGYFVVELTGAARIAALVHVGLLNDWASKTERNLTDRA